MLAFASSRGSWVVSLAVLGLACSGIREDPSPSDNAPPQDPGSQTSGGGGAGSGGGVTLGGGAPMGGGGPFLFEDCACASIIETGAPTLCATCVDQATIDPLAPCAVMQSDCDVNPSCQVARVLLDAPQCADDPSCVGALLDNSLDEDSASLLFSYYACLCSSCSDCNPSDGGGGAGGGGVGGGGTNTGGGTPIPADSCTVQQ